MNQPDSALSHFSALLPPGASILDMGWEDSSDSLRARGIEVTRIDPKPREAFHLLKLEREKLDGIWAPQAFKRLPPEGCQRTLATYFQGLKRRGILFLSFDIPDENSSAAAGAPSEERPRPDAEGNYFYRFNDLASLLRQSGFALLEEARNLDSPRERGALARRI